MKSQSLVSQNPTWRNLALLISSHLINPHLPEIQNQPHSAMIQTFCENSKDLNHSLMIDLLATLRNQKSLMKYLLRLNHSTLYYTPFWLFEVESLSRQRKLLKTCSHFFHSSTSCYESFCFDMCFMFSVFLSRRSVSSFFELLLDIWLKWALFQGELCSLHFEVILSDFGIQIKPFIELSLWSYSCLDELLIKNQIFVLFDCSELFEWWELDCNSLGFSWWSIRWVNKSDFCWDFINFRMKSAPM